MHVVILITIVVIAAVVGIIVAVDEACNSSTPQEGFILRNGFNDCTGRFSMMKSGVLR